MQQLGEALAQNLGCAVTGAEQRCKPSPSLRQQLGEALVHMDSAIHACQMAICGLESSCGMMEPPGTGVDEARAMPDEPVLSQVPELWQERINELECLRNRLEVLGKGLG
jgi:hypothetical protein